MATLAFWLFFIDYIWSHPVVPLAGWLFCFVLWEFHNALAQRHNIDGMPMPPCPMQLQNCGAILQNVQLIGFCQCGCGKQVNCFCLHHATGNCLRCPLYLHNAARHSFNTATDWLHLCLWLWCHWQGRNGQTGNVLGILPLLWCTVWVWWLCTWHWSLNFWYPVTIVKVWLASDEGL